MHSPHSWLFSWLLGRRTLPSSKKGILMWNKKVVITNSGKFVSQAAWLKLRYLPICFRALRFVFAQLPIYFHALFVVHWAVYARTLDGEHMYTGRWTCVHCPVDDGKCVETNRKPCGNTLKASWKYIEKRKDSVNIALVESLFSRLKRLCGTQKEKLSVW